jgi:hypothetical protein
MKAADRWSRLSDQERRRVLAVLEKEAEDWDGIGARYGGQDRLVASFFRDAIVILNQAAKPAKGERR